MYRRLALLGLLVVLCGALFISPVKTYAGGESKGYVFNSNTNGIHALVSTMVGTVSGGEFQFTGQSPDRDQVFYSTEMRITNSCLEAHVYQERDIYTSVTTHNFEVVNNCYGGTQVAYAELKTNSTFRGKYVRVNTYNDTGTPFSDETIYLQIYRSNLNCDYVQIWNYTSSVWDTAASTCTLGSNDPFLEWQNGGGTMDSPGAYCPALGNYGIMEWRGIQLYISGTWTTLNSSNINATINETSYCFNTTAQYQLKTPNIWQWKIVPPYTTY